MRRECRERFPHHRWLAIPTCITVVRHARAVMHVGITKLWFPLKSVVGKTFPAFPACAQTALLRIWQEVHAGTPKGDFAFLPFYPHTERHVHTHIYPSHVSIVLIIVIINIYWKMYIPRKLALSEDNIYSLHDSVIFQFPCMGSSFTAASKYWKKLSRFSLRAVVTTTPNL